MMNQSIDVDSVEEAVAASMATPGVKDNTKEDRTMFMETSKDKDTVMPNEFHLRPTTMYDLEESVEMFNACSRNMIGKNEVTLSDVRAEWLLPDFDLETATRVAVDSSGRLVGYVEVWDIDQLPVDIWVWARVHPEYEGLGIGTALMNWAEQRAREVVGRVPQDVRVVMRSGTYNGYEPAQTLLENMGMKPVRHFLTMAIELDEKPPEPLWPDGISVRTMNGLDEARDVVWAVKDAFRDHWGYVDQPFEQELEHWLHFMKHDERFDPDLWFLAMDGDEIAGVSLCVGESSQDKDMGWVRTLGVRRPWRRQGLGLALLHYTFGEFFRSGQARAGLGVDAASLTGATRLYDRAGMRPIRQFDTFELELRPGRDIRTQEVDHDDTG